MIGAYTRALVLTTPGRIREPIESDRKASTVEVYHLPVKAQDVEYIVPTAGSCPISITALLTGTAGNEFGWECYGIYEVLGNAAPSTTMTYGDPSGLTAVIESAADMGSSFAGSAKKFASQLIKSAASELFTMSNGPNVGVLDMAKQAALNSLSKYGQDLVTWRGAKLLMGAVSDTEVLEAVEAKVAALTSSGDFKTMNYADLLANAQSGEVTLTRREPYFEFKDKEGKEFIALWAYCTKTISHPDNNPRYAFRGSSQINSRRKEFYGDEKEGGKMRVYKVAQLDKYESVTGSFKSSRPPKSF
jgi:hypothetical protein